jgi:hypothetical protein
MARAENGQFIKRRAPPAAEAPSASPPATAAPKPKRPAVPRRLRPSNPAQLVTRVSRAIDNELLQLESILSGERQTPARRTEAERRARMLAQLARTLTEVTRLRAASSEKAPDADEPVPRDLDEFRRTLERRLAQIADADADRADRADEPG